MTTPILWGYFRSSAAYRCRIAFALKGVPVEARSVSLVEGAQKAPDYAAVNPQKLVPALSVGAHVLTQSMAILEWLEETHPEPPLLPGDALHRAEIRAFAQAIACDIHPLNNLRVLGYLKGPLGHDQATVDAWYRHWIAEGLASLEALLARRGEASPYCFGAAPTLADVCLVPQLYNARRFDCPLDAYPRLVAIDAALSRLPAVAGAHPDRQPDAPPKR